MSENRGTEDPQRLFRYLEPDEVREVLEECPVRDLDAGEWVLRAGDDGDRLYLLESGRVEVIDRRLDEPIVLARIGPGDFFGEIALLDGERRTKDVRAVTSCRVRELRRAHMMHLFERRPELFAKLSLALNELLSSRLRGTLADDHPLIHYIRQLERPNLEAPPRTGARPEELHRLYRAILQAKRGLFEAAGRGEGRGAAALIAEFGEPVRQGLRELLATLQETLGGSPDGERLAQAKRLFFQEMYPCLMRSATIDLAYLKPRGYALDHLVLERVLRDEPEGDDPLGVLVDRFALDQPYLAALRRRTAAAGRMLEAEASRLAEQGRGIRVLGLVAGAASEALQLLVRHDDATVVLVDPDDAALVRAAERARALGVEDRLRLRRADLDAWLERPERLGEEADVVYSLMLLDRLDDPAADKLLTAAGSVLVPEGRLWLAASGADDASRLFCEFVLEWFPHRRRPGDLAALLAGAPLPWRDGRVEADPEGINLALRA